MIYRPYGSPKIKMWHLIGSRFKINLQQPVSKLWQEKYLAREVQAVWNDWQLIKTRRERSWMIGNLIRGRRKNREKEQNECLNSYTLAPAAVKGGLEQAVAGGLTLKLVCKVDETIQCSLASIACGSWMYLITSGEAWFCTAFSAGHHGSHRNASNKISRMCSLTALRYRKIHRALKQSPRSYLKAKKTQQNEINK